MTPGSKLDFCQTDLHFDPDSQHDRLYGEVADPLLLHCNPVQGSTGFLQGNPCNENRIHAMRIYRVPCNENRFFPVSLTGCGFAV